MFGLDKTWQLDERLKADTFPIMVHAEYQYLLMNDKRWPWVIIVPMIADAEELHDLSVARQQTVMAICGDAAAKLKIFTQCDKINIAAIGNMVRQLHVHVIGRSEGDANWPGPVWGHGVAEKYTGAEGRALAEQLKEELRVSLFS